MRRFLLVAAAAALLCSASIASGAQNALVGKQYPYDGAICKAESGARAIADYALANKGDGGDAFQAQRQSGACGYFDISVFGPDAVAVVDNVLTTFIDSSLGFTFVIMFHVQCMPVDSGSHANLCTTKTEQTSLYGFLSFGGDTQQSL